MTSIPQPLLRQPGVDPAEGPSQVRVRRPRSGIALCLSGGGFRAAIFHLGAIERLNELGVLAQVDTFSCVSGGSIIGGFLAAQLATGKIQITDNRYVGLDAALAEFRNFVQQDIRSLPTLARLKLSEPSGRAPRALQRYYEQLAQSLTLADLPSHPRFIFCATDLFFGNSWVCERQRVGDYLAGYVRPPPPNWTLARAIATSSCFPPLFDPAFVGIPPDQYSAPQGSSDEGDTGVEVSLDEQKKLDSARRLITLTDGGCYDNLGLEPVWKRHQTILVSDGGKPFQFKYVMPGIRLMRYQSIVLNQVLALRKRWLLDTFQRAKHRVDEDTFNGVYWGIMSATERYQKQPLFGYSKGLAGQIANIRTDLNWFSPNEIAVLEKHGYELADVAIHVHFPRLVATPSDSLRKWPPGLYEEETVRKAISWSHSRWLSTFTKGQEWLCRG